MSEKLFTKKDVDAAVKKRMVEVRDFLVEKGGFQFARYIEQKWKASFSEPKQ